MKNDGISATVEHADKILNLFKYCSVHFGLDDIMNIPTSGTGEFYATPQTIVGMDHWNVEVRDYINILTSYHQMSLDQVRAISGWFIGDKTSSLTNSSKMKTPATDTGKSTGPPACKFNNFWKNTKCPDTGAKYEWCKICVRKNEKWVHN